MTLQAPILVEDAEVRAKGFKITPVSQPYTDLAKAVLASAVKSIRNCPRTIRISNPVNQASARTRLLRALEAFDDAVTQPPRFTFWCYIAEIGPDWLAERMKTLAQSQPLLLKAHEFQATQKKNRKSRNLKYMKAE